ncbi:MAG: hypothetical protein ACFB21_00190 [Opitutales bacterium]
MRKPLLRFTVGLLGLAIFTSSALALPLKGSNGQVVDFAGFLEANGQGLTLAVQPEDEPMLVPWSRIDIVDMKVRQPKIYQAYQSIMMGDATSVNLRMGSFSDYLSYGEIIAALRDDLKQPFLVPFTSPYDVWLESYYSRRNRDFDDYVEAHREWREAMALFFSHGGAVRYSEVVDEDGNIVRRYYRLPYYHAWNWSYCMETTGERVVRYFSAPRESTSLVLDFLSDHPQILDGPVHMIEMRRQQLRKYGYETTRTTGGTIDFVLRKVADSLENVPKSRAFRTDDVKHFLRLLAVLEKGV